MFDKSKPKDIIVCILKDVICCFLVHELVMLVLAQLGVWKSFEFAFMSNMYESTINIVAVATDEGKLKYHIGSSLNYLLD